MLVRDVVAAFAELPLVGLDTLLAGARPLILAPHPDDESLGCGGLIAACCAGGVQPVVLILTDGAASHQGSAAYPPERLRQVRVEEAREAVARLGLEQEYLVFLAYPDAALPGNEGVAEQVERLAREHGCGLIVTPWLYDPHCDHEAAALVAMRVAQRMQVRLYSYPVWGWLLPPETELPLSTITGSRLDVTAQLPQKQAAILAHASQYTGMIDDAPEGFCLPADLLAICTRTYEVFLAS